MSYASTAATSVSISGDISSQLHGGYFHPLARSWQAERQLTKVYAPLPIPRLFCQCKSVRLTKPFTVVNAHLSSIYYRRR